MTAIETRHLSEIAKISTDGRITVPKAIRDRLKWDAGTRLSIEHTPDGVLLRPITTLFQPTRPHDVFACLPTQGKPKSVEEMAAGIAQEVQRRHARGRY